MRSCPQAAGPWCLAPASSLLAPLRATWSEQRSGGPLTGCPATWARVVSGLTGCHRPHQRRQNGRLALDDGGLAATIVVDGQPAAQPRAVGRDQAAPDAVLGDVPVPKRQRQALATYQAASADSDRSRCFLAGFDRLGADREPCVGMKAAVGTSGVPDDPAPQPPVGKRADAGGQAGRLRTNCQVLYWTRNALWQGRFRH